MATTRRTATRVWPLPLTILAWIVGIGLGAIVIALLVGLTVRVYRSVSGPEKAPVRQKALDCSPSSTEACTEREARLALQAQVDSGVLPVHPSMESRLQQHDEYSARVIEANTVKAKAEAEKNKAEWEQKRYRDLQQELAARRNPAAAPISRETGGPCDRDPARQRICDMLSR